jgi:hypothetical protein
VFVVELAGLQAVVQLAEEFVEQVSLGLVVPVSSSAAGIEVSAGAGRGAQGGQRPDGADGCEAAVVDMRVMATGIGCLALSPASARSVNSCAKPAASLPTRPRTTTRPSLSTTATS